MGKTPPKKEEAEGSPKNNAARADDAAWITASAPSPTGKTPPKEDEAEESPRKKALQLFDGNLPKAPGASEPNPTGTPPPKGDEAEGSPPKRSPSPRNTSPRQQDKRPAAAVPLATVPGSSELIVQGRASDEKRCKCNHVITDNAIQEVRKILTSKDALICYGCSDEDKKGIGRFSPEKSDLLICVTCCDHLCCGSITSPLGHSRQHAQQKEHLFAVLYSDPQSGYCFKCDTEVSMRVKSVSRKLLAPPPLVGQTEAEKVEMTGKVQAESHPCGTRSSDAQDYAIRGIKNLGNTCYMSAVLQCLFVLDKLRERMLVDPPKGLVPWALKELLVEANAAGEVLNPTQVLTCVRWGKDPSMGEAAFQVGSMEDSHEFLTLLLGLWKEGVKIYDRQSNAPTVIDSIFRFEMLQILACNKCGPCPPTHPSLDLKLDFPPKWHQRNLDKMQTVSESGYSRVIGSEVDVEGTHKPLQVDSTQVQRISQSKDVVQSPSQIKEGKSVGSEVIVEKTHKPLPVDSTQAQCISQSKDVVQSPLQSQEGKFVDSLTEGSVSIEDFLWLLCKDEVCCPKCSKDHEEPSVSQSKNDEQIVRSSNEDDVGDTVKNLRFKTLPPVLTLHLNRSSDYKRTSMVENMVGNIVGMKISGHVRFEEYLDVKPFMDTSSAHKGSTLYRLAGVVEHIGKGSLKEKDAHYVAYVRARRHGNQQDSSSCSASWFCADDSQIKQVTLEEVLKTEAYILFYERMEDQNPGKPDMPDDILSHWEMLKSDEIVHCDSDLEDPCYVYEKRMANSPWCSRVCHSKYSQYACNVIENNKDRLERLQIAAEWAGQFAFVADSIFPVPVCSLAMKASSHIAHSRKVGDMICRSFQRLKSAIPTPARFVAIGVANQAQARCAVSMWDASSRAEYYCVQIVDPVQIPEVKEVLDSMDARRLLWWFHPQLQSE